MKNLLIIGAALLALTACSSSEKQVEGKMEEAKATATEAVAPTTSTVSEPAAAAGAMSTSCTLDKDTRVIEVRKTDSGGCELFYTKFNEAKSVASSGFGTQYCEEVKDRIQSNLDKAGFACK